MELHKHNRSVSSNKGVNSLLFPQLFVQVSVLQAPNKMCGVVYKVRHMA